MATKAENQQRMFSLIESWQSSGEPQQSFCKSQGIGYSVFHYWYKKYRQDQGSASEGSGFIPVEVPVGVSVSPIMELILPDGRRINFYQHVDATFLRTMLG